MSTVASDVCSPHNIAVLVTEFAVCILAFDNPERPADEAEFADDAHIETDQFKIGRDGRPVEVDDPDAIENRPNPMSSKKGVYRELSKEERTSFRTEPVRSDKRERDEQRI